MKNCFKNKVIIINFITVNLKLNNYESYDFKS